MLIKLCTFSIGFKCRNSKWAVKVVWVRYSLLSLVHLVVVPATNTFTFCLLISAEMKVSAKLLKCKCPFNRSSMTVANLFEPSVDGKSAAVLLYSYLPHFVSSAAVTAIKAQIEASNGIIKVCSYFYFLSRLI